MAKAKLRIAIVGGGLAGTILMNTLLRHSHLDVQLYEARSQIQERGASVGLSMNAQRALRLMGLEDVTNRADAVTVGCLQLFVAEGPEDGNHVYDIDFGKKTVHRAALLRELLVSIPKDSIHLDKRLSSIDGTTLHFTDDTSAEADVVIGADGIHSGVRKFVLGEGHPALKPVPSGFWDARSLMSIEEAITKLGPSCFNMTDPHQHAHIGSKGILFHDFIDDGQRACLIASGPVPSDWDISRWTQTITRKWMDEQYAGWGQYGRDGLDLLFADKDELPAFVQWESPKAPTFYRGSICMIGDAAHAMSPWQGSGLAQAIEDSLILERVLGMCASTQDVPMALEAYDQVRRVHTQTVVDTSRGAAEAYFSAHKGGAQQLRQDIPSREYILNWDTEGAIKQVTSTFKRLREATVSVKNGAV